MFPYEDLPRSIREDDEMCLDTLIKRGRKLRAVFIPGNRARDKSKRQEPYVYLTVGSRKGEFCIRETFSEAYRVLINNI
ncbi:MAG: hypothetical protein JSW08_00120 [archaeon]|nr:MAG: hypothetical protein JSW08_00120 [archaeon]